MLSKTAAASVSGANSGISLCLTPAFHAMQTALEAGDSVSLRGRGQICFQARRIKNSVWLQGKGWAGVPAALVSLGVSL